MRQGPSAGAAAERHVLVIGSINLDLAARVSELPRPGETVTDATLGRSPGGKGGNQALAARRLGARVTMLGCVGDDAEAAAALQLLRDGGVDLAHCSTDPQLPTGLALIAVDGNGENQIIVAPGANRRLSLDAMSMPRAEAMICQLEVPIAQLCDAVHAFDGFCCINLAPALAVPDALLARADLVVVNEHEAAYYGAQLQSTRGYVALTHGARGAVLLHDGEVLARAAPPEVNSVDTTGAGDAFTAALTLGLLEGRDAPAALQFACAAAALATCGHGAQCAMPYRADVDALIGVSA